MNGFGIKKVLLFQKQKHPQLRSTKRKKSMKKQNEEKDKLAKELVIALDYLLQEGFICLIDQKEPRIVLSREANI